MDILDPPEWRVCIGIGGGFAVGTDGGFGVGISGGFANGMTGGIHWNTQLDPVVPWEPLITRSIIHLLEEVHADNTKAEQLLGYKPGHPWREAIRVQMQEMSVRQIQPMRMAKPLT